MNIKKIDNRLNNHVTMLINKSLFLACLCFIFIIIVYMVLPYCPFSFVLYSCLIGILSFILVCIYWKTYSLIFLSIGIIGVIFSLRIINSTFHKHKFEYLFYLLSLLIAFNSFFILIYLLKKVIIKVIKHEKR
jgi:hypothetical protein